MSSSSSDSRAVRKISPAPAVASPAEAAPAPASASPALPSMLGNAAIQQGIGGDDVAVMASLSAQAAGLAAADPFASNQAMQRLMRAQQAGALPGGADHLEALLAASAGAPLPPLIVARMSAVLGHDLSGVRVHTDAAAGQAAEQIAARAFTLGRDVYFAPGQLRPGTPAGDHLLAHELTHVVQHDVGRLPTAPHTDGAVQVSHPHDPAEREAEAAATEAVAALSSAAPDLEAPAAAPSPALPASEPALMRSATEETPEADAVEGEGEGLLPLIRTLSPALAELLEEGLEAVYGERLAAQVETGLADMARGLVQLDPSVFEGAGRMLEIADTLAGVAAGDPRCCTALEGWLSGLKAAGEGWLEDSWSAEAFRIGQDHFPRILGSFGALLALGPELILQYVPGVRTLIDWIPQAIAQIAAVNQSAAAWIAQQLGLEATDGEGVLGVLARAWAAVLADAQRLYDETMGQLAALVMALPLAEEAYRTVDAVLDLTEGVSWLLAHRDDPRIVEKAHAEMGHSWVPGLVEGALHYQETLTALVSTIQQEGLAAAEQADAIAKSVGGAPLVGPLLGVLDELLAGFFAIIQSPVWASLSESAAALAAFVGDVLSAWADVLSSLALAATQPGALLRLLTGEAFLLLPDCYKTAIFDALLPMLGALVGNALAGGALLLGGPAGPVAALLPLIQPALLGMIRSAETRSDAEKAQLVELVASFLAGSTGIEFLQGFAWGLLTGLGTTLHDTAALILGLQAVGIRIARFFATLPMQVLAQLIEGFDSLGDRHFGEDEFRPRPPATAAAPQTAPVDGTQIAAEAEATAETVAPGGLDLSFLPTLMAGLWSALVESIEARAMDAMDLILERLLVKDSPAALGERLGETTAALFGELLLARGAATLARYAPQLAEALEFLIAVLQTPELLKAALGGALRKLWSVSSGFLADVGAFLRRLESPALNGILQDLEDFFRWLADWADIVEHSLGWTPGGADGTTDWERVLAESPDALVHLHRAAASLGDADLDAAARKILSGLHAARTDALWTLIQDKLKEKLEEVCEVSQPEWYDPALSPEENVREYLIHATLEALLDEAEALDPVPGLVDAARRLRTSDMARLSVEAQVPLPTIQARVEAIIRAGTIEDYDRPSYKIALSPEENLRRYLLEAATHPAPPA